jgi:hypothetical protein
MTDTNSRAAIAGLDSPLATSLATSSSRALSSPPSGAAQNRQASSPNSVAPAPSTSAVRSDAPEDPATHANPSKPEAIPTQWPSTNTHADRLAEMTLKVATIEQRTPVDSIALAGIAHANPTIG